jgi:hypothetical protein
LHACFVLLGLFICCGASCHQLAHQYTQPAPRALPTTPTLEDVVRVVNENTARVQTLTTNDASLGVPMSPSLNTTLSLERPRRFRLRAQTAFTGPEVDLGSNDDLFWFWVRRNKPEALFYCRHDQFATSPARQIIPVEPEWLIEALGLTEFHAVDQHFGPERVGEGRLSIRTVRPTALGQFTKVTKIDEAYGWVLEQHLYDERGQRIASALTSDYYRDMAANVSLPRTIDIQLPATQMNMKIRVGSWRVNALDASAAPLWQMPDYPGFPPVDLGNPNLRWQERPHADGPARILVPQVQRY